MPRCSSRGALDLLDELEAELAELGRAADDGERKRRELNCRSIVNAVKRRLERWGWEG